MTSEISYIKEFEDVILNQNITESLKTLIPESKEYIYLQFCDEFKKCFSNKKISQKLDSILKIAESKFHGLYKVLNTRKILLEYDLAITSKERKKEIINELYNNYCYKNLDYEMPFFIRGKMKGRDEMIIEDDCDDVVSELNDDIIKKQLEKENKFKTKITLLYEFNSIPLTQRNEYILKFIESDDNTDLVVEIINYNKPPFYLMTKEEFSKIIHFLKNCKYRISCYDNMTCEQIELLLNEVDNPKYISKNVLISHYIDKKYEKLIQGAGNNLNELKNIVLEIYNLYQKYYPKYCPEVLIYILEINKKQNIMDINPLIEFFKCKYNKININDEDEDENSIKNIIDIPNIDIKTINISTFIENLIIDFFIYDKATIESFNEYKNELDLEKMFYIAKLLKGEELLPIDDKYITYSNYCDLAKKKEITICEHNPTKFNLEEDIKIDLEIKNIKVINISIYEINTENYFLNKKKNIDNSLDIEGLIAPQNFDIIIEGSENPLKRIRKQIVVDQIPKNKRGVYLIDILGDGISSRIIIKKGELNLIYRNSTKGILCQIINEKNELLKDDKTFIWYNNMKFSCEQNEGLIVLPYKILSEDDNICILVYDSYAEMAKIDIDKENFSLKGYFQFLNESLIAGNRAKVTFHPFLFVNGRESPINNIKNGKITVEMEKTELDKNIPIKTIIENIVFNDDNKEYEFEIFIPQLMSYLNFTFDCNVLNSKGEIENLSYEQDAKYYLDNYYMYHGFFYK